MRKRCGKAALLDLTETVHEPCILIDMVNSPCKHMVEDSLCPVRNSRSTIPKRRQALFSGTYAPTSSSFILHPSALLAASLPVFNTSRSQPGSYRYNLLTLIGHH